MLTKRERIWQYYFSVDQKIDAELTLDYKNGKICLKPTQKGSSEGYFEFTTDGDIIDISEVTKPAQTHIIQFIEIMDLFSYYQIHVEFKNLELINKIEGERFTVTKTFTGRYNILKNKPIFTKNLRAVPNILSKLESNTNKESLIRSIRWQRANTQKPLDEFISKWFAFNVLYGIVSSDMNDKSALEVFLEKYPDLTVKKAVIDKHKELLSKLIKMNLVSRYNDNYSQKLDCAIKVNNYEQIWKFAGLCIYQIRNNLFHKGFTVNETVFIMINAFMRDIIRYGMLSVIN